MSTSLRQYAVWLIEGAAAWLIYACFRFLPLRWCSEIGSWLGRFHGPELVKISNRVQKNLAWINPSISCAESERLAYRILNNTGRSYLETMITDRIIRSSNVELDPPENIKTAIQEAKPLVFVTVHLANLGDLMSAALSELLFRNYGYRFGASPTRPISNKLIDRLSCHVRDKYLAGTPGHSSNPNFKTARDYVRALLQGRSFVIFHLDEAYDHQVHFPSFGRQLDKRGNLFKSIKLASSTGALIQPIYLRRLDNTPHFKLEWLPSFQVKSYGAALNKDVLMRYAKQLDELFEPRVFENLADWAQICYLRSPQS